MHVRSDVVDDVAVFGVFDEIVVREVIVAYTTPSRAHRALALHEVRKFAVGRAKQVGGTSVKLTAI